VRFEPIILHDSSILCISAASWPVLTFFTYRHTLGFRHTYRSNAMAGAAIFSNNVTFLKQGEEYSKFN